ncbi:hypothetical protein DPSP01_001113 [Paraphaeosphaeria sporulosa]
MMRVYFKYVGAVFIPSEKNALELFEEHVISQKRNVPWSIADATAKFTIELCSPENEDEAAIFHESHKDMISWVKSGDRVPELDEGAERLKAALETGTLARAVQNMPRLESLVINLNQEWRDDEGDWDDSEDDESIVSSGLQLRLELLQTVRESVAAIFTLYGVPNIKTGIRHLSLLTYLRLTLPCAYDFAQVASSMPDTIALRLRHLYLEIVDGTGPGGDRSYTHSWQGDGDPFDGDEGHRFSNLQRQYPNTAYMQDMCGLVNQCNNLESLGLVGTQCINLKGLHWQPANDAGLKSIYFSRVVATEEQLLSLLTSGREDGACHTEAFDIEDVELMDGTWKSVFSRLLTSSSLVFFQVYNLKYNTRGHSAHLARYNHRPWENVSEIWSESRQDCKNLADLIRTVERRGIKAVDRMKQFAEEDDNNYGGFKYA